MGGEEGIVLDGSCSLSTSFLLRTCCGRQHFSRVVTAEERLVLVRDLLWHWWLLSVVVTVYDPVLF